MFSAIQGKWNSAEYKYNLGSLMVQGVALIFFKEFSKHFHHLMYL